MGIDDVSGTCIRCVLCYKPNIPLRSAWLCGRFWVIARRFLCPHWLTTTGSVWTGKRWGLWSNPPRPKQHQEGERREDSRSPQQQQQQQPQPLFQPAWATLLASLASSDCAAPLLQPPRTPSRYLRVFLSVPPPVLPARCPASRWWSLGFVGRAPTHRERR